MLDKIYNYIIKFTNNLNKKYSNNVLSKRLGSFGKKSEFKGVAYISGAKNVHIGANVHIGENCYFKGEGGIVIQDNCHISRNLTIYSVNHNYEGTALPYDNTTIKRKVIIEKNVWIGMNVNIVPGVIVGEGAIIGLGATVTKNVPKCAIVGGNPAVVIKYRNIDHYNSLDSKGAYGGKGGRPIKHEA